MRKLLVTGSRGLISPGVCVFLAARGRQIDGLDNNRRGVFLGPQGDTRWNQRRLETSIDGFQHRELDLRGRQAMPDLMEAVKPAAVGHAAAEPGHGRAAAIPSDDFDTNAVGTLDVLEATRRSCPAPPLAHGATNRVYGDAPNSIELGEKATCCGYADVSYAGGIPESFTIDQGNHSLCGASKNLRATFEEIAESWRELQA